MFGLVEMIRYWDGHRVWKYPIIGNADVPIGTMCHDDYYALFVRFEMKNGQRYAVYSTRREDYLPRLGFVLG